MVKWNEQLTWMPQCDSSNEADKQQQHSLTRPLWLLVTLHHFYPFSPLLLVGTFYMNVAAAVDNMQISTVTLQWCIPLLVTGIESFSVCYSQSLICISLLTLSFFCRYYVCLWRQKLKFYQSTHVFMYSYGCVLYEGGRRHWHLSLTPWCLRSLMCCFHCCFFEGCFGYLEIETKAAVNHANKSHLIIVIFLVSNEKSFLFIVLYSFEKLFVLHC